MDEKLNPEVQVPVICPAKHITFCQDFKAGETKCAMDTPSSLMPGAFVKCGLPVSLARKEDEVGRDAKNATDPGERVVRETTYLLGLSPEDGCELCEEHILPQQRCMEIPDDNPAKKEKHYTHVLCFWKQRASQYEQMFMQAHQSLCWLVAHCGNHVKVSAIDIQRAQACGFQLDAQPTPSGGMTFHLRTGSGIVGVQNLPGRRK